VDFYVPEKQKLIQVSYSIKDPETAKREIKGLRSAMKELNIQIAWIITFDESQEITVEEGIIHVVPAWMWLLNY
jgi:predicted AAA+ superfamily ATPase